MARPEREHPLPQSQGGAEEPETNPSVPQQEEHRDAKDGKVIADYDPDMDYRPERSDSDIKAIDEEEGNSVAEYAKMELSQDGTLCQRTMDCKVAELIKRVHRA